MTRLATLLLLAAFAATPTPPFGAAVAGVDTAVVQGCPSSRPGSHRVTGTSRPLDPAEADAAGAGLGLPRAVAVAFKHPVGVHASPGACFESSPPKPFHLRERPSNPAHAPPPSA